MSATGRSEVREKDDFYETEPWCVHLLLDRIEPPLDWHVCEPCAGRGAIARTLLVRGHDSIECIELDRKRASHLSKLPVGVQVGDARKLRPRRIPDLSITNPPYEPAQEIIGATLGYTRRMVAMLLRLEFVAPKKRRALFSLWGRPDLFILERRPSYKRTVCWSVFDPALKVRLTKPTSDEGKAARELRALQRRYNADLVLRRRVVNNDACEYAWAVWGLPGGGGHWERLHNGDAH